MYTAGLFAVDLRIEKKNVPLTLTPSEGVK